MRPWSGVALALGVSLAMIACGLDDTAIVANGGNHDGGGDGAAGGDGTISASDGGDSGGGGDAGSSGDSGARDSGSDSGTPPDVIVYANTETDLWSYDVTSNVLTKIGAISCGGGNPADLAIDSSGQGYIDVKSDAVYKISLLDGTCSARNVLDSLTGDNLHITARAAGTPGFLAVDEQNAELLGLDPVAPTNAHVTSLLNDYFLDSVPYDVVCNAAGGCWTALAHNNCSSGSGNACIYAFPADGSSSPVSRGAIGVIPAGLAYANGSLWAFGDDGRIYQVTTSGTLTAMEKTPAQIIGAAAEPQQWFGAASSSTY